MSSSSSPSLVLFDLFINILAHNLAEPAYEADVAQLEYKLMAGEHGLMIRLKGFNHKLPVRRRLQRGLHARSVLWFFRVCSRTCSAGTRPVSD